jgi:hypothetical protein
VLGKRILCSPQIFLAKHSADEQTYLSLRTSSNVHLSLMITQEINGGIDFWADCDVSVVKVSKTWKIQSRFNSCAHVNATHWCLLIRALLAAIAVNLQIPLKAEHTPSSACIDYTKTSCNPCNLVNVVRARSIDLITLLSSNLWEVGSSTSLFLRTSRFFVVVAARGCYPRLSILLFVTTAVFLDVS